VSPRLRYPLANVVIGGLAVVAILDLWSMIASLRRASLLSRYESNPASMALVAANHADHQVVLSGSLDLIAVAVVGVLFLCWLHQLVSNLHRLRPGTQRSSAGWAVGVWFVPFLNLVVPKQVVNDLWRATTPEGRRQSQPPTVLSLWWAGWLIEGVVVSVAVVAIGTKTPTALIHHDRVWAVGRGLDLVVAVLAILIVHTLTGRVVHVARTTDQWADFRGIVAHFHAPPGWPPPPAEWTPPLGWIPDPSWPAAPEGWQFWRSEPVLRPAPAGWLAASADWQYWAN
jgi:hypothetical protein